MHACHVCNTKSSTWNALGMPLILFVVALQAKQDIVTIKCVGGIHLRFLILCNRLTKQSSERTAVTSTMV